MERLTAEELDAAEEEIINKRIEAMSRMCKALQEFCNLEAASHKLTPQDATACLIVNAAEATADVTRRSPELLLHYLQLFVDRVTR